jgi:uncharacterized protein
MASPTHTPRGYRLAISGAVAGIALALSPFAGNMCSARAAEPNIPDMIGPVIDNGNFFSSKEASMLNASIQSLRSFGGPQVQVWTMVTLQGFPIEELTIKAAEKWQLGSAVKDDGLILALAARERRMRIEVGYGLEGVFTDLTAARHIYSILRPALRTGNAAQGVQAWLNAVAALTLTDEQKSQWQESIAATGNKLGPGGARGGVPLLKIILFFLIAAITLSRIFIPPLFGLPRRGRFTGHWGGGSGSGWPGGSGGGWSGGGGGFGGGGSSGGW